MSESPHIEIKPVRLLREDGSTVAAQFELAEYENIGDPPVRLTLRIDDRSIVQTDETFWDVYVLSVSCLRPKGFSSYAMEPVSTYILRQ